MADKVGSKLAYSMALRSQWHTLLLLLLVVAAHQQPLAQGEENGDDDNGESSGAASAALADAGEGAWPQERPWRSYDRLRLVNINGISVGESLQSVLGHK